MGKKKGGKSKGFISQGTCRNVSKKTLNAMRADKSVIDKWLDKLHAYLGGKDPWLTIENPNKEETNKRFIRIKASQHWGPLKDRRPYMIKSS